MNILITGAWRDAGRYLNEIEEMGHRVCFMQWEAEDLPCDPGWVEGVIGNGLFLTHKITDFPNLRYIQLTSAGFDRVPMDYIKEKGITIHNARGVYSIPMAEYAVAGVLCLYKRMAAFCENQKEGRWEKIRDLPELSGKNVLVIGCGSVGTECAKRFRAFGCRITGVDLYPYPRPEFDEVCGTEDIDRLLCGTDILILTVPFSEKTRKLIDRDHMLKLRENAVIVNMARGGVLDLDALVTLKQENYPLMAVLDVFETEPLPSDHPAWKLDGVIVTPHNSFVGDHNSERLAEAILQNISILDK